MAEIRTKWDFCNSRSINTKSRRFRRSGKGSSDIQERDVGGGVANTDGCDTFSWSTFARIVQECRVPPLSPFHPRSVLLGFSSFLPSFPCYISPISPVVSISRTRYSLDRYASRLSLFCLSNTHSTAMWVRIGRLLCSCSRSRSHRRRDDSLYLATVTADRNYSIILSLSCYFRCVAFLPWAWNIWKSILFFFLSQFAL